VTRNPDVLRLGSLRRYPWVAATAERLPPSLDRIVRPRRWRQRQLVDRALGDASLVRRFRLGEPLPPEFGVGVDERAVEYPWLLAQAPAGRVLDAGSVLNHDAILDRFLPGIDELHVVTLAPERRSFPERGVSYVYADLRELPYRDGAFDTVVCVSTLEHVGMDNSGYAPGAVREADPDRQVRRAVEELRRVTAPGGRLLVTVPYGAKEDHGWLQQLDRDAMEAIVDAAGPARAAVSVFAYTRDGWQASSLEECADARYRDPLAEPSPDDLAACARAVACIELRIE
jgi:SAM-dependent methyltransferase